MVWFDSFRVTTVNQNNVIHPHLSSIFSHPGHLPILSPTVPRGWSFCAVHYSYLSHNWWCWYWILILSAPPFATVHTALELFCTFSLPNHYYLALSLSLSLSSINWYCQFHTAPTVQAMFNVDGWLTIYLILLSTRGCKETFRFLRNHGESAITSSTTRTAHCCKEQHSIKLKVGDSLDCIRGAGGGRWKVGVVSSSVVVGFKNTSHYF